MIEELNKRIANVNAAVTRLNNERQMSIGRRDALEKQLAQAVQAYRDKYGIDLNEVGIQNELNRVVTEKTAEVAKMEQVLGCIERGDYQSAEKLLSENAEPTEEDYLESAGYMQSDDDTANDKVSAQEDAFMQAAFGSNTEYGIPRAGMGMAGVTQSVEQHTPIYTDPKAELTSVNELGNVGATPNPPIGQPSAPKRPTGISGVGSGIGAAPVMDDGFMNIPTGVGTEAPVGAPPVGAPPIGQPPKRQSFSQIAGGTSFRP